MTVNEDLVGAFDDCQTLARVQSLCCYYQLYTYDLHVAVINACSERNHWEKKRTFLLLNFYYADEWVRAVVDSP